MVTDLSWISKSREFRNTCPRKILLSLRPILVVECKATKKSPSIKKNIGFVIRNVFFFYIFFSSLLSFTQFGFNGFVSLEKNAFQKTFFLAPGPFSIFMREFMMEATMTTSNKNRTILPQNNWLQTLVKSILPSEKSSVIVLANIPFSVFLIFLKASGLISYNYSTWVHQQWWSNSVHNEWSPVQLTQISLINH